MRSTPRHMQGGEGAAVADRAARLRSEFELRAHRRRAQATAAVAVEPRRKRGAVPGYAWLVLAGSALVMTCGWI